MIQGATTIAPITTAGLLASNPRVAMSPAPILSTMNTSSSAASFPKLRFMRSSLLGSMPAMNFGLDGFSLKECAFPQMGDGLGRISVL